MKVEILPTSKMVKISLPDSLRIVIQAHSTNEVIFYLTLEEARQLINKMRSKLNDTHA